MSHLDEGTLHALLDGELELAEVREIQLHLGSCAACGSRLQDVKQFLAEADRLVGVLEVPTGGHAGDSMHREPSHHQPTAAAPDPQPRPMREPLGWEEPPVLLLPDPLDGQERRRRWMRGLRLAAMVVVVVMGGKLLANALRPGKPQLQFTERDLAPQVATAPAVVSQEERTRPATPAPTTVVASKQPRPAPPARAPAPKPAAAAKVETKDPAPDTSSDQFDSMAAGTEDTTTPTDEAVAAAEPESVATTGGSEQATRQDADLETRRAAAAALAELDRERIRSRANAATSALPPTTQTVEAPAAPRTLEQRSQIYLRIGLDEAVRQLGRPVHVIEAMSPQFIGLTQGRNVPGADAARPVVRVVYLDPRGRMILLDQQRLRPNQAPGAASGSLRWTLGDVMLYLHGEPGPDVLSSLQKRVR